MATITIYYKITNGELHLSGSSKSGYTAQKVDNNYYDDYPDFYWSGRTNINSIVIDNSITLPKCSYGFFRDMPDVTTITNLTNLNTSNVINMGSMFDNCSLLTSLNLSNFNTSKVTDMSFMFDNCRSLTSLDLSSFNTSNVTNMNVMFYNCNSLTELNLSSFNTSKVTTMNSMFYSCSKLISLNLSNFNTSNVTYMYSMFYNCSSLTSLDLSSFNTSKVTAMGSMFDNCNSLTSLNLSGFNTFKVTDMSYMFNYCYELQSIVFGNNFNTSKVTDMSFMFDNCHSLTSLNLSNFNTSKVTNMSYMFYNCYELQSIVFGNNFNTSNVINMNHMFGYCSNLTSLNLSNFNTSKVTNMSYMFYNCYELQSIVFGNNFNTSNVTDMSFMFGYCSNLTSLNLSNFNTSKVTNMSYMFYNCRSLTELNLSSFNTSKVTTMGSMFYYCNSLTSLNLSGFNTFKVTDMSYMFYVCSELQSIIFGNNFNTSNVINMNHMFRKCTVLSGNITINGEPNSYINIFVDTTQEILLSGNSSKLDAIALTANNSNVYIYKSIEFSIILNRMKKSNNTYEPNEEGTYAVVAIDFKNGTYRPPVNLPTFQTITGITIKQNNTTKTVNWYASYNKLTGEFSNQIQDISSYRPTKTTRIYGVIEPASLDVDTTTFEVTINDKYNHSFSVTDVIPQSFFTMDILAGGREISFGAPALEGDIYLQLPDTTRPAFTGEYRLTTDENVNVDKNYYKYNVIVADPQPTSSTWNNGIGWYLLSDNEYIEQIDYEYDNTRTYYAYQLGEADPQPTSSTWNNGVGWYLLSNNEYIEQVGKTIDNERVYYQNTIGPANPQPTGSTWNNGNDWYIFEDGVFINQAGETYDSSIEYYNYALRPSDTQPDSNTWNNGNGWYILTNNEYIEQEGAILDTNKTYYSYTTMDIANPQPNPNTWDNGSGWYILTNNEYVEQINKSRDGTKSYYLKELESVETIIGTENPLQENWYEQEQTIYYEKDSLTKDYNRLFNKPNDWTLNWSNYYINNHPNGLFKSAMDIKANNSIIEGNYIKANYFKRVVDIDSSAKTQTAQAWATPILITDNRGVNYSMFSSVINTDGAIHTRLYARNQQNPNNTNTQKDNVLDMYITSAYNLYTSFNNNNIRFYTQGDGQKGSIIYSKYPNGTIYQAIELGNNNNNITIGWGAYNANFGGTNVYGKDIGLYGNTIKISGTNYEVNNASKFRTTIGAHNAANLTAGTINAARLPKLFIRVVKTSSPFTLTNTTGDNYFKNITLSFGAHSGYKLVGAVLWDTNHSAACTIDNITTNVNENKISATVAKRVGTGSFTDVTLTIGALFVNTNILKYE